MLPALVSRANGADICPFDIRVLVVDDAPANVALLQQLLTRDGYRVITAMGGDDALESVGVAPPDLVLTDVVMPRRDDVSLCRTLQANPATRRLS